MLERRSLCASGRCLPPILPMMARGAAQSIEDSAALAALLMALPDDIAGALACRSLPEAAAGKCRQLHLPSTRRRRLHPHDDMCARHGSPGLS
jgi:hypothetical protein